MDGNFFLKFSALMHAICSAMISRSFSFLFFGYAIRRLPKMSSNKRLNHSKRGGVANLLLRLTFNASAVFLFSLISIWTATTSIGI